MEEEFVAGPARQESPVTIRVLVADDHNVIRRGVRALLSSDPEVQVVGEAGDGPETVRLVGELAPDVVLLDISMPGEDGIHVARKIKDAFPRVHVLILTMHEDASLVRAALQAGAAGYVIKRARESEILDAIHAVYRGDLYIHPAMTRELAEPVSTGRPRNGANGVPLTDGEVEVLKMLARGHTHRQIADTLRLPTRTIEDLRASLVRKLGISSRVDLVSCAEKRGLL